MRSSAAAQPAGGQTSEARVRRRVEVHGTVQGVGFRPFVYRLASQHGLAGWVLNAAGGVHLEVEGRGDSVHGFVAGLRAEAPPLAQIDSVNIEELQPAGLVGFEIRSSEATAGEAEPVPPDTATCDDCLRELFDPADRRYLYPFINCTNCGPRFTVIEGLPYDRPLTTMRHFPMCPECDGEYHDPADRRFHAQPNACPTCGPRVWLVTGAGDSDEHCVEEPVAIRPAGEPILRCAQEDKGARDLERAVQLLREGKILAIKALGGFHLGCDARNEAAVAELRRCKRRGAKPFAVMFPDVESIRAVCAVSDPEARLLTSPRRPIVLLDLQRPLAPSVAPGLRELGAMLPSTPLHHILLREFGGPLVMTSGNLSEEPIAAGNEEALERLAAIADAFLLHDRDIASRYDDSVARVFQGAALLVRRARSYAPEPLALPLRADRPVLALGAHLKSTFCLAKGERAYVSQHLGDLENVETLEHYRTTLATYQRLFGIEPTIVAHDLHPEYLSTKLALGVEGERVGVQHHHAHIVSCLAEHGVQGPAIGVAYDGLGYGTDGHLWGGEILLADYPGFERLAHLREAPMPGGAAAIHKPYRMAVGYLLNWLPDESDLFAPFLESIPERELGLLRQQVDRGVNAPLTSSCGRLFDAVSALVGVCRKAQYEGQAAMELQALGDPLAEGVYPYEVTAGPLATLDDQPERDVFKGLRPLEPRTAATAEPLVIDPAPTLAALYRDYVSGVPSPIIAMRFHRTVAAWTAEVCQRLMDETSVQEIALGGGVFQNTLLLDEVLRRLPDALYPQKLPANDGGISYGQAVVALSRMKAVDG